MGLITDRRTVRAIVEYAEAVAIDTELVRRHLDDAAPDLWDLPVSWNGRLRTTAGRCFLLPAGPFTVEPWYIELNPMLLEEGSRAVWSTFLHELAHALAPRDPMYPFDRAPHGRPWERACRAIGATPRRCHSYASMQRRRTEPKVVGACDRCGVEVRRRRRLKRGTVYAHTGCGGKIVGR